jgi:hypothetical protein
MFRSFKTTPEIIRLTVMMSVRYLLSLRTVEDLLHERGIDITHETVRLWWNRFGTILAASIRRNRVQAMRSFRHRQWHTALSSRTSARQCEKWPTCCSRDATPTRSCKRLRLSERHCQFVWLG